MDENKGPVVPEDKQVAQLKFSLGAYEDIEEYATRSDVEEAINIISERVQLYTWSSRLS